jgi:hypothetical protein
MINGMPTGGRLGAAVGARVHLDAVLPDETVRDSMQSSVEGAAL